MSAKAREVSTGAGLTLSPDRGWIDFDTMTAEVDGVCLPIVRMLDKRGADTEDRDAVSVLLCGAGDKWVSLRMCPPVSVH